MACLKKILKLVDIFGYQVQFRISKYQKHKSTLGGISTIFLFIFSAIYFIENLKNFFKREITLVATGNKFPKIPSVNLTKENFDFSFGIFNTLDGSPISDDLKKIFEIDAYYVNENIRKIIGVENCELLPNNYCLDKIDNLEINDHSKIIINISFKNISNETMTIIHDNPISFLLSYYQTYIIYEDFENPIVKKIISSIVNIDLNSITYSKLLFSNLEFNTDENIFWKNFSKFSFVNMDLINNSEIKNIFLKNDMKPIIYSLHIENSPDIKIITRKYQKIWDLISNLTSVISNFYIILFVIFNFTNKYAADNKILRKTQNSKGNFYLKDLINSMEIKKIEKNCKDENSIDILSNSSINISFKKNTQKIFLKKTFPQILKSFFCCLKKKNRIRSDFVQKEIEYYLDILTYVRKMKEINLFKHILLNGDESLLFGFLSKPLILENNKKEMKIISNFKDDFKVDKLFMNELCKSYQNLKKSHQSKKIIDVFEQEINEIMKLDF
jgi:hypothetical protein